MANKVSSIDDADELVRRAIIHIGDFISKGAALSGTGEGARLLAQWGEHELNAIRVQVFGSLDGSQPADPEIRRFALNNLRNRFSEDLPEPRPSAD
ncbi:hypothetical protein [Kitasatospora sp. NBC_00315]|uniref:hypothetical protein n=1 Tax=Kitasatospora sp. NBC_00315 TaxID=2975963 RepID=UPI003245567D